MTKEIQNWLSENEEISFIELSQNEEFIAFLMSLFAVSEQKAVSDTHKCAIAIINNDKESFSGCLSERLNNPLADT